MESIRIQKNMSESRKPKGKPPVVTLDPSVELVFNIPENGSAKNVSSKLRINNPCPEKLIFKVKTTAPKSYCVRPNSGVLEPNGEIEINVMLNSILPVPTQQSKDKFLVQTVLISDVEDINRPDLWKALPKSCIMENKLKCHWAFESDRPTIEESIQPSATSPQQTNKAVTGASSDDVSTPTGVKPNKNVSFSGGGAGSTTAATKTTTPSSSSSSSSPSSSSTKTPVATKVQQQVVQTNAEQVPSIILLLAVFLLGYIFGKFVL